MHKLDLKKVEEPDIKLLTSMIQHLLDHKKSKVIKKKKNIYFCFIDYTKAFDNVDHSKL